MNRRSMSVEPRTMARRDWLAAAGATLAGLSFLAKPAVAGDDLKTKAKKNFKLGVHTYPYAGLAVEDAARRIREAGFHGVLTEYTFADARFDPLAPDWKAVDKITKAFERNDLQVAAVFGYVNPIDPVPARREQGEARMKCLLENWKRLGCSNISTETGTFNAESPWADAPENTTEAGYQKCREALAKLAQTAEKAGAVVSIEPYWRNIIDGIDRAERLFRDVQSPGLRLVMDPCNYPRKDDLPRQPAMLQDMFKRLGDKIVVAHAKDWKPSAGGTDLPAAGLGVLDYPLYLRLLAGLDREMHLILEHLTLDDVPRARDYVLAQFEKI